MDVKKVLDRRKNPFFHRAEAEYFLAVRGADGRTGGRAGEAAARPPVGPSARRGGEVVGRIAAIHNRAHNEFHDDRVGFFGFFECANDQGAASALFDAAAAWLKPRGLATLRGPASFSTNDECGLLVSGFDTPPTLLNPHNPPYYVDLIERAGFTKAMDMFQYQIRNPEMPERLVRGARLLAERKKITLHKLDMRQWDEAVDTIKAVYNSAWEKNWGFVPMTDAEVDYLAAQLKPVVVPDLVVFCKQEGKTIGFAAALPDLNVALKTNPSGRLFPGVLKILWAARKVTRLRIWALGLLPEYRMSGADALMYHWIWEKGYALGHRWAEAGWILEDNAAMNNGLLRMGFEAYKTLRFYDRPLT
jgi:GNAT superfamily N-acetyltransferase